eukprot:14232166-Ditylum_brightwellii.AAC.1
MGMMYELNPVNNHVSQDNLHSITPSAVNAETMAKALEAEATSKESRPVSTDSPPATLDKSKEESKSTKPTKVRNPYASSIVTPRTPMNAKPLIKNDQVPNWSDGESMREPQ